MAEIAEEKKETSAFLKNRAVLTLTGVEDVLSFDEMSVYLVTENGNLLVEGSGLHITVLDVADRNMTVEGQIDSLLYQNKENRKKGFFSKGAK